MSLVSESGLCFKTTKWGAAVFLVSLEDGRTQGCFVLPKTVEEDCGSFVCVGSIIASPDMVHAKTLHEILRANISRRARVWCEMGGHLGLRVLLPIDIDPVDFRRVVLSLAEDADARELEITGEDAF